MLETIRKIRVDIFRGCKEQRADRFWPVRLSTVLILSLILSIFPGKAPTGSVSAQEGNPGIVFMPFVTQDQKALTTPLIHVPFFNVASVTKDHYEQMAVFWFGRLTLVDNYTHVRMAYNPQQLSIELNIADAQVWYDGASPTPAEVSKWDAASIYFLVPNGSQTRLLRFDTQLSHPDDNRLSYQAAYELSGNAWERKNYSFSTEVIYRGEGLSSPAGDKGWIANYEIPFASFGLSGRPANLSTWKMGVRVYDLDSGPGGPIRTQVWPVGFAENASSTFGQISFGFPPLETPSLPVAGSATIRQSSTVSVPDGSVGGYSVCGGSLDYWSQWGNQVYDSPDTSDTIVIQNQRDVSEFPCFSRYYVTFPLNKVPRDKVILSARLTLHQFGGSNPQGAYPSYIQVFRVREAWQESSLSWNNSPPVLENYPGIWVDRLLSYPGEPGVARTWDVTQALRTSIDEGMPELRLAMQSGDWAMHSGKYFWSSETAVKMNPYHYPQPALVVQWGNP